MGCHGWGRRRRLLPQAPLRTPPVAPPRRAAFTVSGLRGVNATAGKPLDCAAPPAPAFDAAKVSPTAKSDLSCYAPSFQGEAREWRGHARVGPFVEEEGRRLPRQLTPPPLLSFSPPFYTTHTGKSEDKWARMWDTAGRCAGLDSQEAYFDYALQAAKKYDTDVSQRPGLEGRWEAALRGSPAALLLGRS